MEQINILVVDDEKEIADLVEIYLVSDGYKVFKANNAKEGLEILDKEEIHLVLLDIMMPGMDGLEMCRKIRETNNIPIIMLSAKSTDLDKILGLGTGASQRVLLASLFFCHVPGKNCRHPVCQVMDDPPVVRAAAGAGFKGIRYTVFWKYS